MLRHPSLIPLSRQHHNGLALGVLGRRSLSRDSSADCVRRVAKRVIDYFEVELTNHFEIEERILFPVCGALPIVDELLADHRAMEQRIEQLRAAPSAPLLQEFFSLLTAHIRREERELFEQIQLALPASVLEQAGVEIERRIVRVCL